MHEKLPIMHYIELDLEPTWHVKAPEVQKCADFVSKSLPSD